MTEVGIMSLSEIIVILLSLGGFGVAPNPAAPPAAEVLRYAPEDAEVLVYLDAEAVGPGNWQALERLPEAPAVKASKSASDAIVHLVDEARALRAQAKAAAGFDVVTDLRSAAAFVTPRGAGTPDVLVVLRGRFPADTVEHIGVQMGVTPSVVDGRPLLSSPDGKMALGLAADGALVGGKTAWVKERLGAWTPRRSKLVDAATPGLEGRPFVFAAVRPSAATLLAAAGDVSEPLARDLFANLEDGAFALYTNGLGVSFTSRTASGYARGLLAVEGSIALLRAGHQYVRGFARIGAAALDSYATTPEIKALVAHRDELLRLLDASTGDGNFQVAYDRKEAERRLTVRLTGKTLGEVVPSVGLILPIGMGAFLVARGAASSGSFGEPDPATPAPAPVPRPPVKKKPK